MILNVKNAPKIFKIFKIFKKRAKAFFYLKIKEKNMSITIVKSV